VVFGVASGCRRRAHRGGHRLPCGALRTHVESHVQFYSRFGHCSPVSRAKGHLGRPGTPPDRDSHARHARDLRLLAASASRSARANVGVFVLLAPISPPISGPRARGRGLPAGVLRRPSPRLSLSGARRRRGPARTIRRSASPARRSSRRDSAARKSPHRRSSPGPGGPQRGSGLACRAPCGA